MKILLQLVLCACILQIGLVESGVIDRIKTDVSTAGRKVRCGFHKVGNFIVKHEHSMDPCQKNQGGDSNRIDDDEDSTISIDVRGQEESDEKYISKTTENSIENKLTTAEGRRIINAGSNCPPGYRSDNHGNCREEY